MLKTILYVDDEDNLLELVKDFFEMQGYIVFTANNGEAGLQIVHDKKPDLVITDLDMPGMGGIEMTRQIRSHFPLLPVVAVSGVFTPERIPVLEQLGIKHRVSKPFKFEDLETAIKQAHQESLVHD
jgi:CheY-like chemotaxis protein